MSLFKADPQVAQEYAEMIVFLIPLTAIYIMLVIASAFKKIIGYALAAGWGFIVLMMILSKVG